MEYGLGVEALDFKVETVCFTVENALEMFNFTKFAALATFWVADGTNRVQVGVGGRVLV
jgi:hypothetical protein